MSATPDRTESEAAQRRPYLYAEPERPGSYGYVPSTPRPERGPEGHPSAHLWFVGESGMLQLGANWYVPELELHELRAELGLDASSAQQSLGLQPAAAEVHEVVLRTVDSDGVTEVIATAGSSGFPPFTALFRATLKGPALEAARSALGGLTGRLEVSYKARLLEPLPVAGSVLGDATGAAARVRAGAPELPALEASIVAGELAVELAAPVGLELSAHDWLHSRVLDYAARRLAEASAEHASLSPFAAQIQLRLQAGATLECIADVGAWFPGSDGLEHLHPTP